MSRTMPAKRAQKLRSDRKARRGQLAIFGCLGRATSWSLSVLFVLLLTISMLLSPDLQWLPSAKVHTDINLFGPLTYCRLQ